MRATPGANRASSSSTSTWPTRSPDGAYEWLESPLPAAGFACGADFTLADCAAAPALLYADWVHSIGSQYLEVKALRARLLERPSVRRVVDEARRYRHLFHQARLTGISHRGYKTEPSLGARDAAAGLATRQMRPIWLSYVYKF